MPKRVGRVGNHYLREWREHRGLTLAQLAEATGQSTGNVQRIEAHLQDVPQANLNALARALGTTAAAIITINPSDKNYFDLVGMFGAARPEIQAAVRMILQTQTVLSMDTTGIDLGKVELDAHSLLLEGPRSVKRPTTRKNEKSEDSVSRPSLHDGSQVSDPRRPKGRKGAQ